MSGVSKCGQQRSISRRHSTPSHTNQSLKSCGVQTDAESNMFEIKKGTKQGDPLSSLLSNTVLQNSLKDDIPRWQKKKGMGIYLSDHDRDCLTNLRFVDDVLLFATSKEQLQKMLCDFKKSAEKVVAGSTQKRRKFSQQPKQPKLRHKN